MSLLGKGVNKLFTLLGSLLKRIVELTFDLLGFIKFKISKKGYNVREESSKKGKIAGRKVKNNMDKFAIKAQVGTDKGIILLEKFSRLFTFGILKIFNSISKGLYNASEKSKDKFTTYNISQDEKNKEKFIEFDNLIAKCKDIGAYEEIATSSTNKVENNKIYNNQNYFKNIQNKSIEDTKLDLDKTLFDDSNTYNINKYKDTIKNFTFSEEVKNMNDDMSDETLLDENISLTDSIKSKVFEKTFKDVSSIRNNKTSNKINKDTYIDSLESENNFEEDYDINEIDDVKENSPKKNMFRIFKKKDNDSAFDETFHGEDYEFNSSIKLANENYSESINKDNVKSFNKNIQSNNTSSDLEKTKFIDLKSIKEESDKTQMINMDDFREAINSKIHSSANSSSKLPKYSLDDDDESIRKFLSED